MSTTSRRRSRHKRAFSLLDAETKAATLPELTKLESDLFGASARVFAHKPKRSRTSHPSTLDSSNLVEDTKRSAAFSSDEEEHELVNGTDSQRTAAWFDSDDDSGEERAADGSFGGKSPKLTVDIAKKWKLRSMRRSLDESLISGGEFVKRKRAEFRKLNADSHLDDWAKSRREQPDADGASDMFQSSARITTVDKTLIPPNNIAFTDLGEINGKSPHKSIITAVEFHPNGQLLLSAGLDKTLQLFQMSGRKNVLLKRLFFSDLPIRAAKFTADGREVIATGRRYFFYIFKLDSFSVQRIDRLYGSDSGHKAANSRGKGGGALTGLKSLEHFWVSPNNRDLVFLGAKLGDLLLVSRKSKRVVDFVHLSEGISDVSFNKQGSAMYVLSVAGKIYTFAMGKTGAALRSKSSSRSRSSTLTVARPKPECTEAPCVCEGILNATSFSHPPTGVNLGVFAVGCTSGIVSLFDFGVDESKDGESVDSLHASAKSKSEIYSVTSLSTAISGVRMNHDGQLLALWSKNTQNALRLVHTKTGRVYQNWPKHKEFKSVTKCAFSPRSGYLVVGNDSGYIRLIRLHFFGEA